MEDKRKATGKKAEQKVAKLLEEKGYTILEMNYRCRFGEVDIVAKDGATLVFIEVKYRKDRALGTGEEAVFYQKQRKICKCVPFYLYEHRLSNDIPIRFDVAAVLKEDVHLIKNAFEYME